MLIKLQLTGKGHVSLMTWNCGTSYTQKDVLACCSPQMQLAQRVLERVGSCEQRFTESLCPFVPHRDIQCCWARDLPLCLQFSPSPKAHKHRASLFPFFCSLFRTHFDSTLQLCFFRHLNTVIVGVHWMLSMLGNPVLWYMVQQLLLQSVCPLLELCSNLQCLLTIPVHTGGVEVFPIQWPLLLPRAACTVKCLGPSLSIEGWNLGCLKTVKS